MLEHFLAAVIWSTRKEHAPQSTCTAERHPGGAGDPHPKQPSRPYFDNPTQKGCQAFRSQYVMVRIALAVKTPTQPNGCSECLADFADACKHLDCKNCCSRLGKGAQYELDPPPWQAPSCKGNFHICRIPFVFRVKYAR